jgi:RNA polymerase sigma-70 factor (ECF subfamily)
MSALSIPAEAPPATTRGSVASEEISALYEQYKRPLHTYIARLLGSREEADDVVQEVFLSAFVSWQKLTDHTHISAWLYRVATNLCLDQLRKRKRISWWPLTRSHTNNPRFDYKNEEEAPYLPTNSGGIPEIFEREHIRLVLASLPQEYAIVLLLHVTRGISYLDIAEIMEITPCAAATRLSRAKRTFATHYARLNKA